MKNENPEKVPCGSFTSLLRKFLQAHREGRNVQVSVNCGACNACCRDPNLRLDVAQFEAKKYEHKSRLQNGEWVLNRNENGECVYLEDGKCSIYSDRPFACRSYDCRLCYLVPGLNEDQAIVRDAVESRFTRPAVKTKDDQVLERAVAFNDVFAVGHNVPAEHRLYTLSSFIEVAKATLASPGDEWKRKFPGLMLSAASDALRMLVTSQQRESIRKLMNFVGLRLPGPAPSEARNERPY